MRKILVLSSILFLLGVVVVPGAVHAQSFGLADIASSAGLGDATLPEIIGGLIRVFLSILGVIFLVLMIYAGFLWMTAGGDDDKVLVAKNTIIRASIGLAIILLSYAITTFVFNALTGGSGLFGGGGNSNGSGGVSLEPYSGSYGRAIRDHYPSRGATDVPRNAKIFVTFANEMDPASFIKGYEAGNGATALNDENVKIYVTREGENSALKATDVRVAMAPGNKTVTITPPILGSATADMQYTVVLRDTIRSADGKKVLGTGGYRWFFTVGTTLDTTPPTVEGVLPRSGGSYDKNISVEFHFSEPIDPLSATGVVAEGFDGLTVTSAGAPVDGTFEISNGYKTVSFRPTAVCGVNACGTTMFCLPGASAIEVTAHAGTVGANPPQVDLFPADGIVDMTGNALDGDADGVAGDDYLFAFRTTDAVRSGAPTIETISPDIRAENTLLDTPVTIVFDGLMSSASLHSDSILLTPTPDHELWYNVTRQELDAGGAIASGASAVKTQVTIRHGVFLESTPETTHSYAVEVTNQVQDLYQNCFFPSEGPGLVGESCGVSPSKPYCCDGVATATACHTR